MKTEPRPPPRPDAPGPVHLSPRAATAVRALLEDRGMSGRGYLVVSIRGGGCSGLSYVLDLTPTPLPNHHLHETEGITVLIADECLEYLAELSIDYVDDGLNEGFCFENPRARHTCGCGSSFSV